MSAPSDKITILSFNGALARPSEFGRFQTEINRVSNERNQFVIVDFSEVTAIPAPFVHMLVWAYGRVQEQEGVLVAAGMNECISEIILPLSSVIPVCNTVKEARDLLGRIMAS